MNDFFFSGSHDGKLDEKNRFVLPQNFRYGLVEEGKLEGMIGIGLGGCLAIYRRSDIEKLVKKFKDNLYDAKFQKFFTFFFSTLHQISCDKIGRVSIPPKLKKAMNIKKEIVIAGVLGKIEIWPKEVFDKTLNNLIDGKDPDLDLAKMTQEAFSLVSEKIDDETPTCTA